MPSSSSIRRRDFLVQTTGVAASACSAMCLSTDVFAAGKVNKTKKKKRKSKRRPASLHKLEEGHFKEHVGDKFKVSGLRHDVMLKLVEVRGHEHDSDDNRPIHIRQQAFSLLFVAPHHEESLTSAIHEFEHPDFGEVDLLLHEVTADDDAKTRHYEVVFN